MLHRVAIKRLARDKKNNFDRLENGVKIFGLISTSVGLMFTGYSLMQSDATAKQNQKWKQFEFVEQKVKAFRENKDVQLATNMLDYNDRLYSLDNSDEKINVSDDMLSESLIADTIQREFTVYETRIRDIFNEFLNNLSLFNQYVKAKLLTYDQIKPYIENTIKVLADSNDKSKSMDLKQRLWGFIRFYRYNDVCDLCSAYGYEINPAAVTEKQKDSSFLAKNNFP